MLTLADPLDHARTYSARRTAVICGETSVDYATLYERCQRLVGGLRALGVQRGDRVGILSQNCHRYIEAFFAVPAGGMVIVPLNSRLAAAELATILADARCTVLLTDRDPGELANLVERVVRMPNEYETLLASAEPAPLGVDGRGAAIEENDLAAMFFTGGTTGRSKGVMLTHRNLIANTYHKSMALEFRADDVFLAAPALFHVAGTAALHGLVWRGAATVIQPSFEPAGALDLIERHRVTFAVPVPTMLAALVAEQARQPRDISSIRLMGHAAAAMPSDLLRRIHAAFPAAELVHCYGSTETAPFVVHLAHEEQHLDGPLLGSCGTPAMGVRIKIADPTGVQVDDGQVGEICVRGPNVMVGYWENPTATAEALVNGWYRTGDLGYQTPEGYLFVVDRAKDMIISGGENVYSVEVEEVLARHPAVAEVAVFGVPDPHWGEAVHAVVRPRDGFSTDGLVEALQAHCRAAIAGYKIPKRIDLRADPLPVSGPGKVLKRQLRSEYQAG